MRHFFISCLLLLVCSTTYSQFPPGFAAITIAQNLDPTVMTLAPNGDLLLCEKNGRVLIIRNGQVLSQPLIELTVDNFNERGLSGIAVHPDYPTTPYVYLYYTVPNVNHNRLVRVEVVNDQALPNTLQTLLEIDPMPGTIHNGGAMLFGPDGMLYVAVGDGAGFGAAQSLESFLGKVVRLRPDGSIPEDNPFYQQTTGNYRAIWATGLRNPFTFTIQLTTGRMAVGDVGSDKFEEVNLIEKGKNYGWPLVEGPAQGGNLPAGYADPLHAYNHNVGCCVTGAAFYNPDNNVFPAIYSGMLFFGEYCQGKIWYINPATGGAVTEFATGLNRPLSLLTHPDGSIYCITRGGIGGGSMMDNTSSNGGVLWRISYNPNGLPLVATQPNNLFLSAGEKARFDIKAAGNPPFTYQWQREGVDIPGATSDSLILQNVMVADSGAVFSCRISNNNGNVTSDIAQLRVTSNQRPVATIAFPLSGATYIAGQTLQYQGSGLDPENGVLAPQNIGWRIDFHHNVHLHPAIPYTTGQSEGSLLIPQVGETSADVWYRIHLYVKDDAGLSSHVWRDVYPQTSVLTFQTQPQGLPLILDGQPTETPTSFTSVSGVIRTTAAPTFSFLNNQPYLFKEWTDGETVPGREIITPTQNLTLTANYEPLQKGTGTGLLGLYFNNDDGSFTQPISAWRIDPELYFNWGQESPFLPKVGTDNFSIRWLGEIEPWVTGNYYFYIKGDDGVRLQIGQQTLIDSWIPSDSDIRTGGPIFLEAGQRYPIKVEYFEIGGGAVIEMQWGLGDGARTPVPQSQLYPAPYFPVSTNSSVLDNLRFRIVPNPLSAEGKLEVFAPQSADLEMEVFDMAGRSLHTQKWRAPKGFSQQDLHLSQAPQGMYLVRVASATGYFMLKIQKI